MNKSLKTLLAINTIFVLAGNLLGPLYALYIEHLGGDITIVSGTWSVMLLTTTLINALLVRYGDRIKEHEYFLIGGFICRGVAWAGFAFATSVTTIIVLQIIIGIGEAVGSTGFDTIFAEHLDTSDHIKDYATWKTIANIVAATGAICGGLIVTYYGFSPIFLTMATTALLCAAFTYLLPRKTL